jgi:hypothetical protein
MSSTSKTSSNTKPEDILEKILQLESELAKTKRDLKLAEQRAKLLSAHNDALCKLLTSKLKK